MIRADAPAINVIANGDLSEKPQKLGLNLHGDPCMAPPFARPASSGAPQPASRPAGAIPQAEPWGRVKVTLAVSERFRGAAGDSLVVRTEQGTEACGYPFEVGHEYLAFANENRGNVTVTTCSATQPAKMAIARIEQLRALRDGVGCGFVVSAYVCTK